MLDILKTFYKGAGDRERGFWLLFCMLYCNGFKADRGKNLTNLCFFATIKSIN